MIRRSLGISSVIGLALVACQTAQKEIPLEPTAMEYELITERAFVNNETVILVGANPPPDNYVTIFETVIVRPAYTDFKVTPVSYVWVDGEHPGQATVSEYMPPSFETVIEDIVVEPATTKLVAIPPSCRRERDGSLTITEPADIIEELVPAVTQQQAYWKIKTPASVKEKIIKNIVKDGKTRIVSSPDKVTEIIFPAETRQIPRKVVNSTWRPTEQIVPAGERVVTCRLQKLSE